MKNLKAEQGKYLMYVDADGLKTFSTEIFAPDSADLSLWVEVDEDEKLKYELENSNLLNEENEEIDYETLVIRLIRERYSIDEELAILRQRDSKPEEFKAYNDYCEYAKKAVKALINK